MHKCSLHRLYYKLNTVKGTDYRMQEKTYIAIDLKSFFASVECVERGLDPLTTNLVVADISRTEKTICLAVSPSLKSFGIPGRPRLFEVVQKVREVNAIRKSSAPRKKMTGKSVYYNELISDPSLEVDYIVAKPQMKKYMQASSNIYNIYTRYISPEDIHVYSIDEVFIDATSYLKMYKISPRELAMKLIKEVLSITGITATAGIGENLYLAKIAMDVEAKHIPADENGVRIAELSEMSYREKLWSHKPITDFWRVGKGYARKLHSHGMRTMGDIARRSLSDEDTLYKLFGVNAELLIDHAWGWEPCTIADIKAYKTDNNSISEGQVLQDPYTFEKGRIIVREMADNLVLELVDKRLKADQIVLNVGYDTECITNPKIREKYHGEITKDWYGREVPKMAHGSSNLGEMSSSTRLIVDSFVELYDRIVNKDLLVRRMYVIANHVMPEEDIPQAEINEQLSFFTDYEKLEREKAEKEMMLESEKKQQEAILAIKKKFGKNAILKGTNLQEGATAKDRNSQVGGHKA